VAAELRPAIAVRVGSALIVPAGDDRCAPLRIEGMCLPDSDVRSNLWPQGRGAVHEYFGRRGRRRGLDVDDACQRARPVVSGSNPLQAVDARAAERWSLDHLQPLRGGAEERQTVQQNLCITAGQAADANARSRGAGRQPLDADAVDARQDVREAAW